MTTDTTRQLHAKDLRLIAALSSVVSDLSQSVKHDVVYYVQRCELAGVCSTDDQRRACAERFLQGKRKVSAPGTRRRRLAQRRARSLVRSPPPELVEALNQAMLLPAVAKAKAGDNKAMNSLVGSVLKVFKAEPQAVRDLVLLRLKD